MTEKFYDAPAENSSVGCNIFMSCQNLVISFGKINYVKFLYEVERAVRKYPFEQLTFRQNPFENIPTKMNHVSFESLQTPIPSELNLFLTESRQT